MKYYKLKLIISSLSCLIITAASAANQCDVNNVHALYNMPFACEYQNNELTPSAANTIDFQYTQSTNHCMIVSNRAKSVYLSYFTNCQQNDATQSVTKYELHAGDNTIQFKSDCNQDKEHNQANLFFTSENTSAADNVLISCAANLSKKVGNTSEGIRTPTSTPLGA